MVVAAALCAIESGQIQLVLLFLYHHFACILSTRGLTTFLIQEAHIPSVCGLLLNVGTVILKEIGVIIELRDA